MAGRRVTKAELERRRLEVERMVCRRLAPGEIFEQLNALGFDVSMRTVERDLQVLRERWREQLDEELDERRARELAELDEMDAEAAGAFAETQDPRFLAERRQIKASKREMLGLDKGKIIRHANVGASGSDDGEGDGLFRVVVEHVALGKPGAEVVTSGAELEDGGGDA